MIRLYGVEIQKFLGGGQMPEESKYLLVNTKVLPEIFLKVIEAKRLLARGEVKSSSEAARIVGISRSAFYKYKDCVFAPSQESATAVVTMSIQLKDEPGQLSKVIGVFNDMNANITSINQNLPVDGVAQISISARVANGTDADASVLHAIQSLSGVVTAKLI